MQVVAPGEHTCSMRFFVVFFHFGLTFLGGAGGGGGGGAVAFCKDIMTSLLLFSYSSARIVPLRRAGTKGQPW